MLKKKILFIFALFVIILELSIVYSVDYSSLNQQLCSNYIAPDFWNINSVFDECGVAIKSVYYGVLNDSIIRFRCSPDNETKASQPINQTSSNAILWVTNNGTAIEDIQIKYTGAPGANWTFYVTNQSDLTKNFTLTSSYQTIWGETAIGLTKKIWMFANCSFTGERPGISINMQAN